MTFRSALLSCVACATLSAALAAAQLPGPVPREKGPPARRAISETRVPVTVSGCLRRGSLQLADWPFKDNLAYVFNTDVVILDGPKDVLRLLRNEHNLHQDEITGIAIVQASPDGSTTTDVDTKAVGGGTLTTGVRESDGVTGNLAKTVTLRVASFRHLDEKCSIALRSPQPDR
jgi:hypothetical protein